MKYKILANKFLGEQEDDELSFAGIPAIAVKKFADWLDAAEQSVQRTLSPAANIIASWLYTVQLKVASTTHAANANRYTLISVTLRYE